MKRRALLSVTDKAGIVPFAQSLQAMGFEILSTGGTAKALREAGLTVTDVSEVTQFPEMLEGRVKTLHPLVHGGLLGDTRQESHRTQMLEAGIEPIEVLAVNLYAFEATVSGPHTLAEAVESIDIGGPAMIRAASKNFQNVSVVVDPNDYERVAEAIQKGEVDSLRMELMAKAFRHTAHYDSMISRYFTKLTGEDVLPEQFTLGLTKVQEMRYGENPHQRAALYVDPLGGPGIARAKQIWGKELSYNNYFDANGAWELVADLPAGSCCIIKHGNPCGAAAMGGFAESYHQARASDPVSAFGGIAAFNGVVDKAAAEAMTQKGNFLEVVIATQYDEDAVEVFRTRDGWGQSVRLLTCDLPSSHVEWTYRAVRSGLLVQSTDESPADEKFEVVTAKAPTEEQAQALRLMWSIVKHVGSNAIVVGGPKAMLGVGAGQMNRVQSVRLALDQAGEGAKGAVLASDAFFPFPDSIETAAKAGISAIIQPGGSKKDGEVIAAANDLGIAMVFTGVRHFRH